MALDVGDARIGIALSDLMKMIASPLETLKVRSADIDTDYIAQLVKEKDVETVVVGLPLRMDGNESDQTVKTKTFAAVLENKISVPIVFQDERLTSVSAENALLEADMRRDKRKQVIDQVAAALILQAYLK